MRAGPGRAPTPLTAEYYVQRAAAVAFGRLFLANPNLPGPFRLKAPLDTPDDSTFYGPAEKGYTDYPALSARAGLEREYV
jgi:2,4-dienoyl-CoA reductase-like NADH-dependent reductase (Old Yellow Enzyme family)